MANLFWAKVPFSDFIRHFRKLSDEQIVKDVKESMDALEDSNGEGDCFGAFMVRSSQERVRIRGEVNRANALAGHEKAGHNIRTEQAPQISTMTPVPQRKLKFPSKEEVYDFCQDNNLDGDLGREWYEITISRGGKDRAGHVIENWKGAVKNYITARIKNLEKDTK